MLRASAKHQDVGVDLAPIVAGCGDAGLESTDAMLALIDAVVLADLEEYPDARVRAELAFSREGADRIVMVAANFIMMNRLMDAVGGPVSRRSSRVADELGVTIPDHLLPGS